MINRMRFPLILLIMAAGSISFEIASGQAPSDKNPVELGKVGWHRGFDRALEQSKKSDKPLLVLFQEVPG